MYNDPAPKSYAQATATVMPCAQCLWHDSQRSLREVPADMGQNCTVPTPLHTYTMQYAAKPPAPNHPPTNTNSASYDRCSSVHSSSVRRCAWQQSAAGHTQCTANCQTLLHIWAFLWRILRAGSDVQAWRAN
jgi:hypothetical protein